MVRGSQQVNGIYRGAGRIQLGRRRSLHSLLRLRACLKIKTILQLGNEKLVP
jgi:hypothetical protein